MTLIIMFIVYVLLASSGLILFKQGSLNPNLSVSLFNHNISFSLNMILGLLCYVISFILWMLIVSKMNLTIAMPLSVAIVNTLVIVESCLFLKEKLTLMQAIGIFIVIIGVVVMTASKK